MTLIFKMRMDNVYKNEPLDNLINDLFGTWLSAYFQSSWKDSYEGKAHLLPKHFCVCVYVYTYILYMHSCTWFWKLAMRIIGSVVSPQCTGSFKWDRENVFSKLSNFMNSVFLIFFRTNSEQHSYNYLGDTLKDYLMLLQVTININILSTMYFYRIVEILTELFIYNEVKILEEQSMTNHLVINTLKCKSLRHQSTKRCMAPVWWY